MIVAVVLCCDRKQYSLMECLQAVAANPEVAHIYLNVESTHEIQYTEELQFLATCGKPAHHDFWSVNSTWRPERTRDQDNTARLPSIITARNMGIDYALYFGADHLLYVDSDVIIPPDSARRLEAIGKPIVGGVVPGRGAHAGAQYVFGVQSVNQHLLYTAHGTAGFMMLHKDVFRYLRFRQGPHPVVRDTWLSEDPTYAADAYHHLNTGYWVIDSTLRAAHRDDPDHPMTIEQADNTYTVVIG